MNTPTLPTREILWNVPHVANVVVMYLLLAVCMVIAALGLFRRIELWISGHPDERRLPWYDQFYRLVCDVLFQRKVVRDRSAGVMHTLIYFGFLVLLFTTTMVFIDHDLGIRIYHGDFYLAVTLLSDVFGFGVLVGCTLAAYRRYINKPDRLHSYRLDAITLGVLILLIIQGFLLEGLRIHVTNDPWAAYSPIGKAVAGFFWPLSEGTSRTIHYLVWWFHTLTVFVTFALLPYTKFFHIIASAANLYFNGSRRPAGALRSPGDLEALMESGEEFSIGRSTIRDYTWKELLDLDACTSCGRCQEACPAYASGKPLSPKWLILDSRNHALALQARGEISPSILPSAATSLDAGLLTSIYLKGSGLIPNSNGGWEYEANGVHRAPNPEVQRAARSIGQSAEDTIAGQVMDENVFWSCTTCMACVEACPVGINHVDQIVENRRNMVLMRGEVPSEAQGTIRALENRGNPYGDPNDRVKWAEGLTVPILKPGDKVDYLYWVGCVSAYDPRKQKIARALVQIMNTAGLSYGILGNAEGCSGDPARRLGEENVFQSLAKRNIELLKSITFKSIVANCPHCFNTIKNEYPQFGNLGE